MESTHSGTGWKPAERSQNLILSRFGSILPPLLLHVEKKLVLGMNCPFHLQLRGKVSSTQVRFVYTNPQWYVKSGKDTLSLILAWFWQDNDIFLEGHNVLCLLIMSGLPCWGWHTEHLILQEPPSPCPTSRDFCYIDFKTDIHCQARSLYHPASQWGIFLMFKFTQQPTVIQGMYRGLFCSFHFDIYRCYMMQALPTLFFEDGGKACLPVITTPITNGEDTSRTQSTWLRKRRLSCHFPQQT